MHISELIYKKHKIFRPREKYGIIYIKNLEMMEKYQGKFHIHLLVTMGNFYIGRHFSVCCAFSTNINVKYYRLCIP